MLSLANFRRRSPSVGFKYSAFCFQVAYRLRLSSITVFAGQMFDIAPEDFLELGQVPTNPMYCIGGILGSDSLPTPWLMCVQKCPLCWCHICLPKYISHSGGTFLQSVYTTFDIANVRVGFAKLASAAPSTCGQ